jgi:predicted lipoprotein with Yx(FWY)xxD motif
MTSSHRARIRARLRLTDAINTRVAASLLVVGALAMTAGVTSASGASRAHAKSLVISSATSAKFGTILVSGRTLYTLKPNATSCSKKCRKFWIEVLLPKGVTKVTAGGGVNLSKLGTTKGVGGALQVTYGGRALYWFIEDKAPGMVKGNVTDIWGKWSVVVLAKPRSKPSTTTTKPTTTTTKPMTTTTKPTTTTTKPPTTTTTTKPAPTTTTTAPGGGGGVGF